MSKKKTSISFNSLEQETESTHKADVVAMLSGLPQPAPARTPLETFFASCVARDANQTDLSKQARANPEWVMHVDDKGFNALTLALLCQKKELAKTLIELGSNVNQTSKAMGWTPLVVAAGSRSGEDSVAQLLLEKGASPSSKTHHGLYALTSACTFGNLALATRMLEAGAKAQPEDSSWFPIVAASGSGCLALVQLLIERGADPDQPLGTLNGFRSIHQAAKAGHVDIVQALLAHGVEVNPMSNEGDTPLHYAAQLGNVALVKALLKEGADSNLENVSRKIASELSTDPAIAKLLKPFESTRVKHPMAGKKKTTTSEEDAVVVVVSGIAKKVKKAEKELAKASPPPTSKKPAVKKAMQELAQRAAKKLTSTKIAKTATKKTSGKPASNVAKKLLTQKTAVKKVSTKLDLKNVKTTKPRS